MHTPVCRTTVLASTVRPLPLFQHLRMLVTGAGAHYLSKREKVGTNVMTAFYLDHVCAYLCSIPLTEFLSHAAIRTNCIQQTVWAQLMIMQQLRILDLHQCKLIFTTACHHWCIAGCFYGVSMYWFALLSILTFAHLLEYCSTCSAMQQPVPRWLLSHCGLCKHTCAGRRQYS